MASELSWVNSFMHAVHDDTPCITRFSLFAQVITVLGVTNEPLDLELKTKGSKFTGVFTQLRSFLLFLFITFI